MGSKNSRTPAMLAPLIKQTIFWNHICYNMANFYYTSKLQSNISIFGHGFI